MTITAPLTRHRFVFTNPDGATDGLGSITFTMKAATRAEAPVIAKKMVCTKLKFPDFICADDCKRADS